MGKSSKYPGYATGSVEINGNKVATSSKTGKNTYSSSYNMTDAEKSVYDGVLSNLDTSLKDLFSISDAKQEQWNQTIDAYKQKGIKQINDIYDPMQNALKNDIASRFGNLDNSIFMDNLSNITENKAQAVADLSDSLIMKQNDLYSTEMANRMNYISLLNGLYSGYNSQMMNFMQLANANTASGNNYNQAAYQAAQQNNAWNRTMQGLNTVANVARAVSSFTPQGATANIAGNLVSGGTPHESNIWNC